VWLDTPQPMEQDRSVPILRPQPGRSIQGELAGECLRCFIHWHKGRTWPCTGSGCELCKRETSRRVYSFYPVRGKNGQAGIIEMTALAEAQLLEQMSPHTQVPSGTITISRPPGKRNASCHVDWKPATEPSQPFMHTIDQKKWMEDALCRLWKLPRRNGEQTEEERTERLNQSIRKSLETGDK
jgi:inactivated superfamily I helicase